MRIWKLVRTEVVEKSFEEVMQNAFRREARLNGDDVVLEMVVGQWPEAGRAP